MLTVLMASYNGAATLPAVLDAYCRLLAPRQAWQLVFIDNGSSDGTAAIAARYAARLPLRCLQVAARGKNVALNAALEVLLPDCAEDTVFVFTDDDASPAADWLQQWERVSLAQPDYALFGGAITACWPGDPPLWLLRAAPLGITYGLTAPDLAAGPVYPGLVWGANMAVRAEVFRAGHRFDATRGPDGSEYAMGSETEFTRRVALAGYRAWHHPAAVVAHHIRPAQLLPGYVLRKARRFGRGQYREAMPGQFPELLGIPRWMWRRYLIEAWGALRAMLRRDACRWYACRWELAYWHGYAREAWRRHRRADPRRPRRVLITSYSGELGGMELRMADEVRLLQAQGHRAALALRDFPGRAAWARQLAASQVDVAHFDPPPMLEQWRGRRRLYWQSHLGAARRMRAFRADLVHVAFCWTQYGASALWLAAHCRIPAVVSVHNAFPPTHFARWQQRHLRKAWQNVRGVYAVSASALAHFLAIYRDYLVPGTRLAVIANPVDTTRFQPCPGMRTAARARWQLPAGALVVGSVARLSAQKQPATVIALFAMLRQQSILQRRPLYLVLAGCGPLEAQLRTQVAHMGLSPWVVFTGFVDDVAALLPALDLHVLLSRSEGFGIATAEAMACGVPVITTDVPGSADLLRGSGAGLLVDPGNMAAAVPAIAALLADPARRAAMGRQGRVQAVTQYSHTVVAAQLRAFYDGLV